MKNLNLLGWDAYIKDQNLDDQTDDFVPARVIRENKQGYLVQTETLLCKAELSGKLGYKLPPSEKPKVGDWIAGSQASDELLIIKQVLPRKNKISRKVAGNRIEEQILATNIDLMFIVIGLDHDFNMNRLERYLSLGKQTDATPIIVLNKMDICEDLEALKQQVLAHSEAHKILMVSAEQGIGIHAISELFQPNKTGVLIGSSGVGKSTIINSLIGENTQLTREVREDDSKGVHTTSFRQLFLLPNGGSLIDTPGMRELSLWDEPEHLDTSFQDIASLAEICKFRNCKHTVEKGCAVQDAILSGDLDKKRYDNYLKVQKELDYLQSKRSEKSKQDYKQKQKKLYKSYGEQIKHKGRF